MASKTLTTLLPCLLAIGCLCAQNPNTARWPASNAADTDLFVVSNQAQTTLNGNINSAVTSLVVTSGALFVAPVIVTIQGEVLHCTTVSVNTLSGCSRGQEGSAAAPHTSGATVFGYFTAWHFNQAAAEIKAIEANASKQPALQDLGTTSGTPAFTVSSQLQTFKITLSGNVTASTLATPVTNGILFFDVCQNGTGNFTFAWPSGFSNAMLISGTASVCSKQAYVWDGANAIPLSAGTSDDPFASLGSLLFANLGAPRDGSMTYCSDCTFNSGSMGVCAGSGTGTFAFRIAAAWRCQ